MVSSHDPLIDAVAAQLRYLENVGVDQISRAVAAPAGATVSAEGASAASDDTLDAIRVRIGACTRCRLCEGRTHIVFGVGNPHARLMFVGEAPGADEDAQGEPFVGRAGQLLNRIIEAMGLQRADVYIGNINKCLRYDAMVQLGDGSWERIGRLVRGRYDGTVMSVDEHGAIVPRQVIGWHETPLGDRKVYRLTYRSAKRAGSSRSAILATEDHPVLTKRGYVPIQQLLPTDCVAIGQGFSPCVRDVIYGSLLGDAHIPAGNAHFVFAHSYKQERYASFKVDLLQEELPTYKEAYQVAVGEKHYPTIRCRTTAHRALGYLRHQFYDVDGQKRVPPELAHSLTPRMLAFWFMDDGYMRLRPGRRPLAEIATCAFSQSDLEILLQGLSCLGVAGYIRRNRIYFDTAETTKLAVLMAPYMHWSMRYKLPPEIALQYPFDLETMQYEPRETFYDFVDVELVDFTGTDKTFYCIDVDGTHNFVTVGGVVHNCRPPQNRAPLPDEAATCLPFLLQQIAVIQPEIIVCLGSVATRYLLGQEDLKISRVRGKFQEWQGLQVMPTFHPAYLLRNPAAKKDVWEDMQKVMAKLGLTKPQDTTSLR